MDSQSKHVPRPLVFQSSKALGIEVEIPGMGLRARRGLFMIEDGTVTSAEIEAAGKFEISSAEACQTKFGK